MAAPTEPKYVVKIAQSINEIIVLIKLIIDNLNSQFIAIRAFDSDQEPDPISAPIINI